MNEFDTALYSRVDENLILHFFAQSAIILRLFLSTNAYRSARIRTDIYCCAYT